MKRIQPILLLSALTIFLLSCTETKPYKPKMKNARCYIAIDRADTAWLKVDTTDQKFFGELAFNFNNEKHFVGDVKGLVKSDTLDGHYVFKVNQAKVWHRNPVSFLKQGKTLTMGIGEINILLGAVFFNEHVPIDYNRGRFVFNEVGCEVK